MAKELNIQMIRQAQAGNTQSMSVVSEQVRRKIYTYIYRLTMDYHIAQDLTQDTVLEMIKALPQLKIPHVNGFWGWIFRTALGKVQHHFRVQGARRLAQKTTSDETVLESYADDDSNAANTVIRKELRNAVIGAMKAIKFKYRNILVLRCLDNLPYNQIAMILGVSELNARLLFFRAKHSLKGQLHRHGFKRDSLLAGLTIFAGLTLKTGKKAAAEEVVLVSSLETGLGMSLAGLISLKAALAGICVLCLVGFTVSMIQPETSSKTLNEQLYGHLYPLLDHGDFVAPSYIVEANDPDNDGFLIVEQTSPESSRQRLQTDQFSINLANQPHLGPALPKDHWIELGFDGPIRDDFGPDILLKVQGCRSLIRVFITDGAGQLSELPRPQCLRMGICRTEHILDFDLQGLDLPFEPHAVRLLGAIDWGPYGGIRFYSLHARIQISQ